MVQSVGAASGLAAPPVASSGALRSQLAAAERQLVDCLTCDTARTPSGQAKIATLTQRVHELKDRLEILRQAALPQPPPEDPAQPSGSAGPPGLDVTA